MAAISWGNRIRDFLITKGVNSTQGTFIQTMVNRMTTQFADVTEDSGLILMLERVIRQIVDVARSTYGLSLNQANTLAWITANRPDYAGVASLYSYVVATDLNTNLVPAVPTVDSIPPVEVYAGMVAAALIGTTRLMRYFAGLYEVI